MKIKYLLTLSILLAAFQTGSAQVNAYAIQGNNIVFGPRVVSRTNFVIKTFNAVNNNPKTTFSPGETVLVTLEARIPEAATGKKLDFKLTANLKVGGQSIPFNLTHLISFPNTNFLDPSEGSFLQSGYETFTFEVPKLPKNLKFDLVAQISNAKLGTAIASTTLTINKN